MHCDICQGTLEIQASGKAVCSVCGVTYSAERLREKARIVSSPAPSTTPAPVKQSSHQQQSKLRMAESALRQENYDKAITLCEQILVADYHNLSAWNIKIRAMWANTGSRGIAADQIEEVCSMIQDPAQRADFLGKLRDMILEDPRFDDNAAEIGEHLCACDPRLAESYLNTAIDKCTRSVTTSCKNELISLRDMHHEAETDLRWASLMGQNWKRVASWMGTYLKYAIDIWNACGSKCQISVSLKKLIGILESTVNEVSAMMPSGRDIPYLKSQINRINGLIEAQAKAEKEAALARHRAAVQKYWEANPEAREQLEAQQSQLIQHIYALKKSIPALSSVASCRRLEQDIAATTQALESVGFFEFSKKKELNKKLADLQAKLSQTEKQRATEIAQIEAKIAPLDKKLKAIKATIENPFR